MYILKLNLYHNQAILN